MKIVLLLTLLYAQAYATELTDAVAKKDRQKVQQLLAEGADVNEPKGTDWAPLYAAAAFADKEIAQLLLDKGADINGPIGTRPTPLFVATSHNNIEVAKLLIDKGADINKYDLFRTTPFHRAAEKGNKEIAQLLIYAGADPFIQNKEGKTALDLTLQTVFGVPEKVVLGGRKEIQGMLEQYMPLFQEAQQKPTYDTLRKMIERGYPGLVKQLLTKIPATQEQITQLTQLGKVAQAQFIATNNPTYKQIGQILKDYLSVLRLKDGTTASGARVPAEITHLLAGYTLEDRE
ncbi:ankyrin repeat domain-containing protein [Candidatus Dependentiae bacterium]|nr:ankyrin repeat domain-containing protein [Candidatus Dependentiae bacterium]